MSLDKDMKYDFKDRLSFLAEWQDPDTPSKRRFFLNYYPWDNTLELYEREANRIYLRRTACEGINFTDIYVGNVIRIFSRQVHITEYADAHTCHRVGKSREHTVLMVKPSIVHKIGEIINRLYVEKLWIRNVRMCQLTHQQALDVYYHLRGDAYLPFLIDHVVSGPVVMLELVGDNAIGRVIEILGPFDSEKARQIAPTSLRAIYGVERALNGFHAPHTEKGVLIEIKMFFPRPQDFGDTSVSRPISTVKFINSTLCIIKPHAIHEGKFGQIMNDIIMSKKFSVTAMQSFYFTNKNAEELLEVYKGVVSDFHAMLLSFLDGVCIALEISEVVGAGDKKGEEGETHKDIHGEFRTFVGPSDPDVARQIRPNTLRAKYGVDKWKNALHCTDLKEDTVLDLEYLFKIIS